MLTGIRIASVLVVVIILCRLLVEISQLGLGLPSGIVGQVLDGARAIQNPSRPILGLGQVLGKPMVTSRIPLAQVQRREIGPHASRHADQGHAVGHILLHDLSDHVEQPEHDHGAGIAPLGGAAEPPGRLGHVALDAPLAVMVQPRQQSHGRDVPPLGAALHDLRVVLIALVPHPPVGQVVPDGARFDEPFDGAPGLVEVVSNVHGSWSWQNLPKSACPQVKQWWCVQQRLCCFLSDSKKLARSDVVLVLSN